MPLSDHEQRQLEEIALALSGDDPTFLSEPSEHTVRRGRNVSAEIAFVLGAVLLLVGVATMVAVWVVGLIVGVVGFLMMLRAWPGVVAGRYD